MTEEQKKKLHDLPNIPLVEELLKLQQDADRLHEKRASAPYGSDEWIKYHEMLYDALEDVIEAKYIVLARMG